MLQKCTQYVYRPIHICKIKRKTSFTVSSLHKPHYWRNDISCHKHRHIGKAQSMVWRSFYKYTCHVSTNFYSCTFSTLCMLLKPLVILCTVDWHPKQVKIPSPVSHANVLFFHLCALWPNITLQHWSKDMLLYSILCWRALVNSAIQLAEKIPLTIIYPCIGTWSIIHEDIKFHHNLDVVLWRFWYARKSDKCLCYLQKSSPGIP